MPEHIVISTDFSEALQIEDWDRVEELWLSALDAETIPTSELLEVRRQLWKAGKKAFARTLIELLAETLESAGDSEGTLAALREMTRLAEGKPAHDLVDRLSATFAAVRSDSPSLKRVLEHHQISAAKRPLEELEKAECWLDHEPGTIVEVVGQGVGRVVDLNLELENIKVDLGGSRPVSVPFGAVTRYLRCLPEGDFRRRKVEDPEALADLVHSEPGEALVQLLESLEETSNVASIKAALTGILDAKQWNSWWAKARKHPRIVSSGSGSRLCYQVSQSAESAGETLLEDLRSATPSDRLKIARRLADRGSEGASDAAEILSESLNKLESSDPGIAWLTAGTLATLPGGEDPASASRQRLLETAKPLDLLSGATDRGARSEALEALADAKPGMWPEIWAEWILHEESRSVLNLLASRLGSTGHDEVLEKAIAVIFRNHAQYPHQFVWACEMMTEDGCHESIRQRMTPSLLEKLPDTLSRKEFSPLRARAKALLDGGKVAIRLLMESANPQQATRFSQRIARLDVVEPQRARLIEQAAQHRQEEREDPSQLILVATRASVDEKTEELRQLLQVEIPKTLKGINAAAAEGDLRENFEYHMLRDRQELQSAKAAKLQEELGKVRILEPGAADTSAVNIGTVVYLESDKKTDIHPITILGAWDADPDSSIYANGAELAEKLLGLIPGSEAELPDGKATITRIEPWKG